MTDLSPAVREVSVTLPDGARRSYPVGVTGAEIAADISKSLAKAALAVTIDGRLDDLSRLTASVRKLLPWITAADWQPRGLLDDAKLRARLAPPPQQMELFAA